MFLFKDQPEKDLQRIKNIPGVGYATMQFDSVNSIARYQIYEVNTLLPIINFGGIKDNYWYRLGLADANFRGEGQNISLHYQNNDGRHSGQFYYRDPFFIGSRWGYIIDINRWASEEPLFFEEGRVNYEFRYSNLGLGIIRNFGINRRLQFVGNYFIEEYQKNSNQQLQNPPGPDALRQPKFLINSSFTENFINYNFFLLDGYEWRFQLQNVYNFSERDFFHIVQFQLKRFFSQPRFGNLALRFRLAFSTNNYSPFAPFVADSYVNIRGVGNRIDRGTGQAIFNLEYRKTILKAYPFGIQLVAFSDLGSWRNPGGQLNELISRDSFRHFVGGGIRMIYQQIFGATFRVDYGIDLYDPKQRGFVLGLGQYF
ncbi:BamA/TamA family outer membrane protein [Portibacter marinus]|uniref:BamA/TamA family outer membrane protein n=1 Tax=Portibacter marinus TaxID=2898660 RepID=UPI001F32C046|nr:BamA/TamA family outer membrane protein [Portibacter marinus]